MRLQLRARTGQVGAHTHGRQGRRDVLCRVAVELRRRLGGGGCSRWVTGPPHALDLAPGHHVVDLAHIPVAVADHLRHRHGVGGADWRVHDHAVLIPAPVVEPQNVALHTSAATRSALHHGERGGCFELDGFRGRLDG